MVLICGYGRELAGYYFGTPKRHAGELDGAAWVREDPSDRALLAFLAAQPPSIVLERIPDRSYVASPAVTIFAGQTAFLGWPNHEDIWRAYQQDIDRRAGDVEKFYLGNLPDSRCDGWSRIESNIFCGGDPTISPAPSKKSTVKFANRISGAIFRPAATSR